MRSLSVLLGVLVLELALDDLALVGDVGASLDADGEDAGGGCRNAGLPCSAGRLLEGGAGALPGRDELVELDALLVQLVVHSLAQIGARDLVQRQETAEDRHRGDARDHQYKAQPDAARASLAASVAVGSRPSARS